MSTKNYKNRIKALEKYLNSEEGQNLIIEMQSQNEAKHKLNIEFSKSKKFKEILNYIKNKDNRFMSIHFLNDGACEGGFSKEDIESVALVFYDIGDKSIDHEALFTTDIYSYKDFIMKSISGQGTVCKIYYKGK